MVAVGAQVAAALLLRDVQTGLDQTARDEIARRTEERGASLPADCFEEEIVNSGLFPGGAFYTGGNLPEPYSPSARSGWLGADARHSVDRPPMFPAAPEE